MCRFLAVFYFYNTPIFVYAHPELFPYGVGDYISVNHRRTVPLSRNEWIRHMLLIQPNSDENDMYTLDDGGDCQTHPDFLQYGHTDTHQYCISMAFKLIAKANINGLMYVADIRTMVPQIHANLNPENLRVLKISVQNISYKSCEIMQPRHPR